MRRVLLFPRETVCISAHPFLLVLSVVFLVVCTYFVTILEVVGSVSLTLPFLRVHVVVQVLLRLNEMWRVICTELGWKYRKLENNGGTTTSRTDPAEMEPVDGYCSSDDDDEGDLCWLEMAAEEEDDEDVVAFVPTAE